jgi:uncharacterized protein (DUF608 family)
MPKGAITAYPLTQPRVYRDKNLQAVAMPIGGIGTGSIWLNGEGRLAVWQIFIVRPAKQRRDECPT